MSRKVKLGTQRKNEERKKQALKINKIGRPSKVKWLELAPGSLKGAVSLHATMLGGSILIPV